MSQALERFVRSFKERVISKSAFLQVDPSQPQTVQSGAAERLEQPVTGNRIQLTRVFGHCMMR